MAAGYGPKQAPEAKIAGDQDPGVGDGEIEYFEIGPAAKAFISDVMSLLTYLAEARRQRPGEVLVDEEGRH